MAKQMENGQNQEIEEGRQSTSRDRPNLGISRDSGASIDVPCLAAAVSGSTENGPFEFAVPPGISDDLLGIRPVGQSFPQELRNLTGQICDRNPVGFKGLSLAAISTAGS